MGDHKEPHPNPKGSEMGEGFLQPTSQLCLWSLERGVWILGWEQVQKKHGLLRLAPTELVAILCDLVPFQVLSPLEKGLGVRLGWRCHECHSYFPLHSESSFFSFPSKK